MKAIRFLLCASLLLASHGFATAAVDKTALRQVLDQQEFQLATAERELTRAQAQLKEAQAKTKPARGFFVLFTGIGLAGMALTGVSLFKMANGIERFGPHFGGATLITGLSATGYFVETHALEQFEKAVAERLELVRAARERVARLKAQLDD